MYSKTRRSFLNKHDLWRSNERARGAEEARRAHRHHAGEVSPVRQVQPWQRMGALASSGRCAVRSRGARMLQASAAVKAPSGRPSGITHAAQVCSLTAAGSACVQFMRCVFSPGNDASCKDPARSARILQTGSSPGSLLRLLLRAGQGAHFVLGASDGPTRVQELHERAPWSHALAVAVAPVPALLTQPDYHDRSKPHGGHVQETSLPSGGKRFPSL